MITGSLQKKKGLYYAVLNLYMMIMEKKENPNGFQQVIL